MNMRIATLALVLPSFGCTATTIQSTWRDPTFAREPFDRVAVVALFDTVAESRTFEERAARELEDQGADAVPAFTLLGDDRMREQDELRSELAQGGVDGILIYRLIAVDEREVYRNPAPYLSVPPSQMWGDPYYWYYYPRWDYYSHWRSTFDVTRSRGYWEPLAFVIVESSLYDAETDRLVWTAKSETIDGTKFETLAASVAAETSDRLVAMNLLERSTQRIAATVP